MKAIKTIKIGEGLATVKSGYSSRPDVVKILGKEEEGGFEYIYLDSLIHRQDDEFDGWTAYGAISTILKRPLSVLCREV